MPRKARMYIGGMPCHVIQRGNNRACCFLDDPDRAFYLQKLGQACTRYKVDLHAYVLMTNHSHLLMTPEDSIGISRVMQSLGRCYVQFFNKKYNRTGTLWESRHRSSLIGSDRYLLACYRYIEMNPVRAGMVAHPSCYEWSSFRAHALGETNDLITDHCVFNQLHSDTNERRKQYTHLFDLEHEEPLLEEIRTAARFSMPLGNLAFRQSLEKSLNRKLGHFKRGRPQRSSKEM